MEENIYNQLNDIQRKAVEYCDGPSLVIAGAGAGKTRVLTYKVAWLLDQGYAPWRLLVLTFTNKAAREMKERINKLVGGQRATYLMMGTFHSVFAHVLRIEASYIGFNNNYTIYDETDSRSMIKSIIKEMKLDEKIYKPATVYNRICMAKNHLVTAEHYHSSTSCTERDSADKMPAIGIIYTKYQARCRQANAVDFDDLLLLTYQLFSEHDDIRKKYAERFQYILVDEYQDTNTAQQAILLQLSNNAQRICVVGDDAQSIYGFRGANIDNILDFQERFKSAKLFKLEQNYRSTQYIVQAANSLIAKNKRQIQKEIISTNQQGEKLIWQEAYSDQEEALIVCKEILQFKNEERADYSDFAILYRTNSQSRSFEEAMRKNAIPYRIFGGISFYQRKEIKDVIAYFRMVVNPNDEEAFKRIVNYPTRGIGEATVRKITEAANQYNVSLWKVVSNPTTYTLNINKGTRNKLSEFCVLIDTFMQRIQELNACQLGTAIISESGILNELRTDTTPEGTNKLENLQELLNGLQIFVQSRMEEDRADEVSLIDYLQEVALFSDLDSNDDVEGSRVSLMTIHSAKGLEFPFVFIVGLEENLFPSTLSLGSQREIEEERRLLYVAITRAERRCILTSAKNRWRYGHVESNRPSRFLDDIAPQFIDKHTISYNNNPRFTQISYGAGKNTLFDNKYKFPNKNNLYQNSHPIASQYRAASNLREVDHRNEHLDPFSSHIKQTLSQSGRNMHRVSDLINHNKKVLSMPLLTAGNIIEHERFGIGNVLKVEGNGENTKATVEFRNAGTKQLLLKFAKYKVIK